MDLQFKHFTLTYFVDGKEFHIENQNFDKFSNEHLELEFIVTVDEDQNAKIYKVILNPIKSILLHAFNITSNYNYNDTFGVFANGYQSWTESNIYYKTDKIKPATKLIKRFAFNYGDYKFINYSSKKGCFHSWNYTYIKLHKNQIDLVASLNDSKCYTIFEHQCNENQFIILKDCEGMMIENTTTLVDFVHCTDLETLAFNYYKKLRQFNPIKVEPKIGWTSWYHYYTNINEEIILNNLNHFTKNNIPIGIFQIDDGWQQAVGDWLNIKPKFRNGMASIANKIKAHNIEAGLWLAPFACEKNSFIYREKPDWILKDEKGQFLKIGYNPLWSGWFYALDFFNEEVRDYLKTVFDTILNEWQFDLVKLDFLYGTAAIPQHGKSRSEVMHLVMAFLRNCVGNKMILGCGVPLSAAENNTDYCRIGPDIHLSWDFKVLKLMNARERPSTYNAIQNTISRRHLNQLGFINDPDVFILRQEKNLLNRQEQYSLLLANLLFGDLLFCSDDISKYNQDTLFLYKSIFPLVEKENIIVRQEKNFFQINFNIKENYYVAIINTSEQEKIYKLPNGNFYDNQEHKWYKGDKYITIPKHSSKCLYRISGTPFALYGSKGHFFCGCEIEQMYLSNNVLEIKWNKNILNDITIYYRIPKSYEIKLSENILLKNKQDEGEFIILELSQNNKF